MIDTPQQLALNIHARSQFRFDNFYAHGQEALLFDLRQLTTTQGELSFYLFGPPSSGKTHLLQAACGAWEERGCTVQLLPLSEPGLKPDILEGLELLDAVAFDDVNAIAGQSDWEEALFNFFNRARAQGCRLLFAANAPLASLAIRLPDLHSRLSWGLIYGLKSLDDENKAALLQIRANEKGLELPPHVARFLLQRHSRDLKCLMTALDTLDRASWASQRRLTIPFVREVLK